MAGNLKGSVADIILNNVHENDTMEIVAWIRHVLSKGCANVNIDGLTYHDEITTFFYKHKKEIDVLVWDFEMTSNINGTILQTRESVHYAVEIILKEIMKDMYLE